MIKKFGQFFFLLLASFFLSIISACDNENNKTKNQQVSKTIPVDLQSREKITNDQKIEAEKITETKESSQPSVEANNTDKEANQIEKPIASEVDTVKAKLEELESNLDYNNSENEALRQHMEVLLKKVQENQSSIENFEQSNK